MASQNVSSVNDQNFQSNVLQSDKPVLVDFTATWCGPCKAIAPLVDQLADEYVGKLKVTKLDIDEAPNTASQLGIRGVPTLVVFKGGREVARQVGAVNKTRLVQLVSDHL